MADETTTDKLLASLAEAEKNITATEVVDRIAAASGAPAEPMSAVDRLRAFEDEKVGADAPRFAGALERGVGSLFSRMTDADKAMHGKMEKLVETEAKLAAAHTALIAADNEHEAALKAVDG